MPEHWYNNGVTQHKFEEGEQPEGWVRGMKPRTEEEKAVSRERARKTNLERWGTENPCGLPEIQEKKRQTSLAKYGYESPNQSPEVKKHKNESMLKKYGHEHALQVPEFYDKVKQTTKDRFGNECAMKNPKVVDKVKQTNLEKYGYENVSQVPEVQEKRKQTCLDKWGVEWAFQADTVKQHIKESNLQIYGCENPSQNEGIKEKKRETLMENYGVDVPLRSDVVMQKTINTNIEKYGVPFVCMSGKNSNTVNSFPNENFAKLLCENHLGFEREFPIVRYSYDFKVGNALIEINPYATHNSLWTPFGGMSGKDKNYHQNKSRKAAEAGYHCIHIFDWDDPNKIIKELLLPKERIYARDTTVCGITKQEAKEFLNEHHLQGYCNGQSVLLGLRDKCGELVSLMTFGKPRYNKNYQYELIRYCQSKNVIGGAEKLFKYFLKTYNPESIISYCDMSKFSGNVYLKLGFTLKDRGKPSCHWYSDNSSEKLQHITDNLLRQRGYDILFGANFGKGTSNEELIIDRGYVPIYDSGQNTYIYISNKGE